MRKLLVYIVLLMHVNTYMFFPMVDETDQYEQTGRKKDDINSLVEYINQVLLGHRDNTPEDEDDDQAHYYHIKSAQGYLVSEHVARPPLPTVAVDYVSTPEYGAFTVSKTLSVSYDITAPPPEA